MMSVNSVDEKQSLGLLEKLVQAALERNVLVVVLSLGLLLAGVWAYSTLRVDAVPDVSNVQVTVTTSARGLAPLEVEQYITYPVELALQSLPRLVLQRSVSKYARFSRMVPTYTGPGNRLMKSCVKPGKTSRRIFR